MMVVSLSLSLSVPYLFLWFFESLPLPPPPLSLPSARSSRCTMALDKAVWCCVCCVCVLIMLWLFMPLGWLGDCVWRDGEGSECL